MSKIKKEYRASFNYDEKCGFQYFKDKKNPTTTICKAKCFVHNDELIYKDLEHICKKFNCKVTLSGFYIDAVAISKCSSEDEYDELIGRRIAESRCKKKLFSKMRHILREIAILKQVEVIELSSAINQYRQFEAKEDDHIKLLSGM